MKDRELSRLKEQVMLCGRLVREKGSRNNPHKLGLSFRALLLVNLGIMMLTIIGYFVFSWYSQNWILAGPSKNIADWLDMMDFISKPTTLGIILSSAYFGFKNYDSNRQKNEDEWEKVRKVEYGELIEKETEAKGRYSLRLRSIVGQIRDQARTRELAINTIRKRLDDAQLLPNGPYAWDQKKQISNELSKASVAHNLALRGECQHRR